MKYYQVEFKLKPHSEEACDVLSSLLADIGFEAFVPVEGGLMGYVQQSLFDEEQLNHVVSDFILPDVEISARREEAPDEDWNQTWENEGFEPVVVDDLLCVHDANHSDVPHCRHDIIINPRMAFGTGTHATTRQILTQLCSMDLRGKRVVDAGCGTGVLSILAAQCGASEVFAYDIDEWSVENTRINAELNEIKNIIVREGDAGVLPQDSDFDLVVANINRKILLNDMPRFVRALMPEDRLLLSGFYVADIALLADKGKELGMEIETERQADGWAMLLLRLV